MGKELDFLIRTGRPLTGFGSGKHFVRALDMREDEPIGFLRVSGAKLRNDDIGTDDGYQVFRHLTAESELALVRLNVRHHGHPSVLLGCTTCGAKTQGNPGSCVIMRR